MPGEASEQGEQTEESGNSQGREELLEEETGDITQEGAIAGILRIHSLEFARKGCTGSEKARNRATAKAGTRAPRDELHGGFQAAARGCTQHGQPGEAAHLPHLPGDVLQARGDPALPAQPVPQVCQRCLPGGLRDRWEGTGWELPQVGDGETALTELQQTWGRRIPE